MKQKLPLFLFAVTFGIWADLSAAIAPAANDMGHCLYYEPELFSVRNLAIALVSGICIFLIMNLIREKGPIITADAGKIQSGKAACLKVWGMLMVSWGIWWIIFFPGTAMNDTINMIESMTSPTSIMPPFYTAFIYWWMKIGMYLFRGSSCAAFALLVFAQMSLGAAVVVFCYFWLEKKRVRPAVRNLFLIFYAFYPVVADYSIAIVKDMPYAFLTMLLIPLLYDLMTDRASFGKVQELILFISMAGIWACRSNGRYIVFLVCFILFLTAAVKRRKLVLFLFVMCVCNTAIVRYDRIYQPSERGFAEAVSVTYAQIGATVSSGGEIAAEDRNVLFQVLPEEEWALNYNFSFVDRIKFNRKFDLAYMNGHKKEYLQAWAHTLIRNPRLYFKAYGYHSYGLWNLSLMKENLVDESQSVFTRINNNTGDNSPQGEFLRKIGLYDMETLPADAGPVTRDFLRKVVYHTAGLFGAGWLLLTVLVSLFYILLRKKYRLAIIFAPALGNWVCMMLASPGALIYRYHFYLLLSLPLFVLITLIELKN